MTRTRPPERDPQTPAEPDEDAPLVARFNAGDKSAFQELVVKHQAPIRALVGRYIKTDEAQDVAQRAFLRAFEKLSTFRGESSFRTWLSRIAIHLALNHLRGNRDRMESVELDDIAAFTNALETGRLVAAEMWKKVSARLTLLPPKQRLVVELRFFHELSFKEISAVAGCSEESAKANFHHGVKRLRDVLQKPPRSPVE